MSISLASIHLKCFPIGPFIFGSGLVHQSFMTQGIIYMPVISSPTSLLSQACLQYQDKMRWH